MGDSAKQISNGLVIVFDGIDGVGKSTQLELAKTALESEGWSVHTSRNLGGTPIGEELREVMLSTIERPTKTNLYISVAIQEALLDVIEEERSKNQIILLDRGPFSLAAYEIYGSNLDESIGWQYVDAGMLRLKPELTIIYKTNTEEALKRLKTKSGQSDYFERMPQDYFERVSDGYEIAAKRYEDTTTALDAGQAIEVVHEQTMQSIKAAIEAKLHSN
ncbi:MAG: dTMP kinase [Patescibacteria group bacterium]